MASPAHQTTSSFTALVLTCALGIGCVTTPSAPARYTYFSAPSPDDQWSPKISGWQRRERADELAVVIAPAPVSEAAPTEPIVPAAPAAPVPPTSAEVRESDPPDQAMEGSLRVKYAVFRAEQKRSMARSVAEWTQSQALEHYVEDGPMDHWATLEETLRNNGDDCDGLELLTFHALRELGFEVDEVFRAIVYRTSDGQHHMVTLWFEDPTDPWVIDPTGAMTLGMPRMSELPDWVPVKLFSESTEYTVNPEAAAETPFTVIADSR